MNAKEFANLLNGRKYPFSLTREEQSIAKDNGLVVAYGSSDDLLEFEGAISEEFGACGGTEVPLGKFGFIENECDNDECPHFLRLQKNAVIVKSVWCDCGYSWLIETEIPHETFDVVEDGEPYCRAIVFSMRDLDAAWSSKQGKESQK